MTFPLFNVEAVDSFYLFVCLSAKYYLRLTYSFAFLEFIIIIYGKVIYCMHLLLIYMKVKLFEKYSSGENY